MLRGRWTIPWILLAHATWAAPRPASLAHVAVPFVANRGQTAAEVAYYAPTFAGTVYVTSRGEIVHALRRPAGAGWTLVGVVIRGHVSELRIRLHRRRVLSRKHRGTS